MLGAETEGMIGYMIEQELGNLLPFERAVRDAADHGRGRPRRSRPSQIPTKFIGPVYDEAEADRLAAEKGWVVQAGRRQVAPRRALARARSASSSCGRSSGCSRRAPS